MSYLLVGIGALLCVGLAMSGYLGPVLIGGFLGSFFGVAGFGGAISGMIPGGIVGALVAISMKSHQTRPIQSAVPHLEVGDLVGKAGTVMFKVATTSLQLVVLAVFVIWIARELLPTEISSPVPREPSSPSAALRSAALEPISSAAPARMPMRSVSRIPDGYDQLLSLYEGLHPEINPDSSLFNATMAEVIYGRVQRHLHEGMDRRTALTTAMTETYGAK